MISRPATALLLAACSASAASAFTAPSSSSSSSMASRPAALSMSSPFDDEQARVGAFDPFNLASSTDDAAPSVDLAKAVAASSLAWAATSTMASANDSPNWGVFEGRIGSLLHPTTMGCMFLLSLSTGFLGLQWRRQRTLGEDIGALRKTLPDLGEYKSASEALKAQEGVLEEERASPSYLSQLQAAVSVEGQIKELADERKELSSQGLRDKHFNQGAILMFLGTAAAIEGPLNTYARAGKLFPGPHLYAGAGCVVLWSLAAACVPSMSKGSDTARSIHIAANTVGTGLFGWQVLTGWPILLKVVELTKWP